MNLSPTFGADKFICPHCEVSSQQTWFDVKRANASFGAITAHVFLDYRVKIRDYYQEAISAFLDHLRSVSERYMKELVPDGFSVATCGSCGKVTLWVEKELVFPKVSPVAPPNSDMEDAIQALYLEAAKIVVDSPRGATALLRLAVQLLLKQLGKLGKNINADIKALVAEGLSVKIQRALDLLRVIGNNAVHPGQVDMNDGMEVALKLFPVLNFIAEEMITKPKELERLYSDVVPDATKKHIGDRDRKES